uniref:Uncharacterized protein n=1 Tax=Eutreptiella gymnastica TaxID=73025 RepID=A0A7S1J054_9EUGL|mmetsp:Transcript_55713/g.99217  ORF Transcript_55713/g.99217 Transcript_55713/m.99217 type:complete len:109 (+) Transcript_55713:219-545(+)
MGGTPLPFFQSSVNKPLGVQGSRGRMLCLERDFRAGTDHGRSTWMPMKVVQLATGTCQDIVGQFQDFHPELHISRVAPKNHLKTSKLGQTKAAKGFSTLKGGGDSHQH